MYNAYYPFRLPDEENKDPTVFYMQFWQKVPIEGNFVVQEMKFIPEENRFWVILVPSTDLGRIIADAIEVELDTKTGHLNVEAETGGHTYQEVFLSPADKQYIFSLIPTNVAGGG